jgi:alkylation response protein AidB-like acyl-CoA dehydrogenase
MSNAAAIQQEVKTWLAKHWNPDLSLLEWRSLLADSGWGQPTWPVEFCGKGLTATEAKLVQAEFDRAGAIGPFSGGATGLAAATLLEHGNQEQKQKYLRRMLTGEDMWCQLFSEPGSGSDLAGATTRADWNGDHWVVNGQKVWNTSAHHADFGILVARTNWDVPKHQGISYFLLNMRQPGVEVRPLKQMNGHASFNEVFFTDAIIEASDLVGEQNQGWSIALTTLTHERASFGSLRRNKRVTTSGRIYAEYQKEQDVANEPYTWYPQRAGRIDMLLERARETGTISDPLVRQEIATAIALQRTSSWFSARGLAKGPAGSVVKLAASRIARAGNRAHTATSGIDALFEGDSSPHAGIIGEILLSTPATSIAGGTDEIQKNIISERVLELPKEPRFDGGPFKDVAKN